MSLDDKVETVIITKGEKGPQNAKPSKNNGMMIDISVMLMKHLIGLFFHDRSVGNCKRQKRLVSLLHLFAYDQPKLVRYLKEIAHEPSNIKIVDQSSLDLLKENLAENDIHFTGAISSSVPQYLETLIQQQKTFNIIEFDPLKKNLPQLYHSILSVISCPGIFILNIPEFGMISGNAYHERCQEIYGGSKMGKHSATIEAGIRLVLSKVSDICKAQDKKIQVLMCNYLNGVAKVYVEITESESPESCLSKDCWYCQSCDYYTFEEPLHSCNCDQTLIKCGPFWTGPLKDNDFLILLLDSCDDHQSPQTRERLKLMIQELNIPMYINPLKRAKTGKQKSLKAIRQLLFEKGYESSISIFNKKCIKTNCPFEVLDSIV